MNLSRSEAYRLLFSRATLGAAELVELSEDFRQMDRNLCAFDPECVVFRLCEAPRRSVVADSFPRINDPYISNAHGSEIVDALLQAAEAIFTGEDFYAKQGRYDDDHIVRICGAHHADVRDAETRRVHLDPLLRHRNDAPRVGIVEEDGADNELQQAVRAFSHGSLLKFAVDVIAVRAIGGAEIFAYRDEGCRRHALPRCEHSTLVVAE